MKYDDKEKCNKCGCENIISNELTEGDGSSLILEADTKCSSCGFEDHWAYGLFRSKGKKQP